jgi:hypothetical protein
MSKKRPLKLFWTALALGLIAVQITACSTAPANASTVNPPLDKNDPFAALQKGMAEEKVRELLGAPKKIEADPEPSSPLVKSEIWIYERSQPGRVRQVVTSVEEMVGYDPRTGHEYKYPVPIYSNQTEFVTQTIELLMIEGRFAEVRQKRHKRSMFH